LNDLNDEIKNLFLSFFMSFFCLPFLQTEAIHATTTIRFEEWTIANEVTPSMVVERRRRQNNVE
jgi:hypothetical protein